MHVLALIISPLLLFVLGGVHHWYMNRKKEPVNLNYIEELPFDIAIQELKYLETIAINKKDKTNASYYNSVREEMSKENRFIILSQPVI